MWSDGIVLPKTSSDQTPAERNIFIMDAKSNPKNAPLTMGSVAMIRDKHKLIYYLGHDGLDNWFEMYEVINDPEELDNLYSASNTLAGDLKVELLAAIDEANKPYLTN